MSKNIVLIGMPGSGKSTIGVVLAKKLGRRFVDSDLVIQEKYGKLLHELISENGVAGFWELENDVNCNLGVSECVIATGGSAVYGTESMEQFSKEDTVVYLNIPEDELASRLGDLNERGVTLKAGQTLHDLYEERKPLYEKYADLTIACSGKQLWEIVNEIAREIRK